MQPTRLLIYTALALTVVLLWGESAHAGLLRGLFAWRAWRHAHGSGVVSPVAPLSDTTGTGPALGEPAPRMVTPTVPGGGAIRTPSDLTGSVPVRSPRGIGRLGPVTSPSLGGGSMPGSGAVRPGSTESLRDLGRTLEHMQVDEATRRLQAEHERQQQAIEALRRSNEESLYRLHSEARRQQEAIERWRSQEALRNPRGFGGVDPRSVPPSFSPSIPRVTPAPVTPSFRTPMGTPSFSPPMISGPRF